MGTADTKGPQSAKGGGGARTKEKFDIRIRQKMTSFIRGGGEKGGRRRSRRRRRRKRERKRRRDKLYNNIRTKKRKESIGINKSYSESLGATKQEGVSHSGHDMQ